MKARTIWRLVILAVLFSAACVLGVLCLFQSCMADITPHPGKVIISAAPSPTPYVAWGVKVEPEQPTLIPPETAAPQQTEAQQPITASGSFGVLTVGRKEIPIAGNVDEATLEKSPGWMPDSARPGESGMCVILGHRNRKHLRPLENVAIGDEITFTYPDGRTAVYTVAETMIYENTADWRLPAVDGDTLVLVTCYPFHYTGHSPGKYQVIAKRAD